MKKKNKIKPYFETELGKLYHGDCLEVLSVLPGNSIDLIVADPPFNVGLNYTGYNDKKGEVEYWNHIESCVDQFFRVSKNPARFYSFHADKGIYQLKVIAEKYNFKFHQMLVWYGPNLTSGGKIGKDWHTMFEPILLFHKGKRTPMLNSDYAQNCYSVLIYSRPQRNFKEGREHVAQKPIKLLLSIIGRSPGEIVLDPFAGSGTGPLACEILGRKWIGIEISKESCKIVRRRIEKYNYRPLFQQKKLIKKEG